MIHFADLFKKSFLEGWVSQELTLGNIGTTFIIATVLSFYIYFTYRIITRKTFYSKNFATSLVCIALITSAIIITIQQNIVLSLGMVGALSIVRFRTAVKDPMDLVFLFWSLCVGIICGAHVYKCAIMLCFVLTAVVIVLQFIPMITAPMILVVETTDLEIEDILLKTINLFSKHAKIKCRNITQDNLELTIELHTKRQKELINNIYKLKNISSVNLLSHDGEITY